MGPTLANGALERRRVEVRGRRSDTVQLLAVAVSATAENAGNQGAHLPAEDTNLGAEVGMSSKISSQYLLVE